MCFGRKHEQGMQQNPTAKSAEHQPGKDEGPTDAVASISDYLLRHNVDEHDPCPEGSAECGGTEEAETAGANEPPEFPLVGEEVQTILFSAQDAAAKIRSRAEDEAGQLRNEAASAAEAEVAEAQRFVDAARMDAHRLRAEAEVHATETRAAADAAAEQRRTEAEAEAARILEEAQRRRDAIDAELAQEVEHSEAEARQRISALQSETARQEERLDAILFVLRSMTSQVAGVLGRQEESDDLPDAIANMTANR